MNNKYLQAAVLVVVAVVALFLIPWKHQPAKITDFESCRTNGGEILETDPIQCMGPDGKTYKEDESPAPDVMLDAPQYGDLVASPIKVSGKARGNWFFEAQMPVTLKDDQGKVLFQGPAHADGDWMTNDYVPFSLSVPFVPGDAQYGVLIISRDNPSGDPANDASYAVPVRFK